MKDELLRPPEVCGARVYVIAEIASAHEGRVDLMKKLISASLEARADAVKVQMFRVTNLVSRAYHKYESFQEIELSEREWEDVLRFASSLDIDIVAEVYDLESFDLAERVGDISAYKLSASDIDQFDLLEKIICSRKPIFLGTGGATDQEIQAAVRFVKESSEQRITLLHGYQSYPTKIQNTFLGDLPALRKHYGCLVGFADHTDATDQQLRLAVPSAAIALGASVIEKHITLDRKKKGRDHFSALEPTELRDFIKAVRQLPRAIKKSNGVLCEEELTYRWQSRKVAVARYHLPAATKIDEEKICFKRIGVEGMTINTAQKYYGKALNRNIDRDAPIFESDIAVDKR